MHEGSDPVWNKVRIFHGVEEALDECELRLSFVEADKHMKDAPTLALPQFKLLGSCTVPLKELLDHRERPVPVEHSGTGSADAPCQVFLRLLPDPPATKSIFYIRHARSKWNNASHAVTHEHKVQGRVMHTHPL